MFQPLFVRSLTEDERKQLALRAESLNREEARRAGVVLLSSEGRTASDIARSLGFHPSNVKKWVRKFNEDGLAGIAVRKRGPREGPRPSFTRDQIDRLLDLASTAPAEIGYSFERWTAQKLANAAVKEGIVDKISHVTVQQILKRNTDNSRLARAGPDEPAVSSRPVDLARAAYNACRFSEAADRYKEALKQDQYSIEEEAEIRSRLSNALGELSRFDEAYEAVEKYEVASVIAKLSPLTRARTKLRIGWAHSWLRDHAKAIAALNDAKKIFLELQDEIGVCEAHHALGRTYIGISEFRIARDHLLAAVQNQSLADADLMARIYLQLGTIEVYEGLHSARDNYLEALAYVNKCPVKNENIEGMILLNLGTVRDEDDPARRKDAIEYAAKAISCLEKTRHKDLPLAYNNMGDALSQSGQWNAAIDSLRKAVELAQSLGQPNHEATGRATLSEILLCKGLFQEAEEQIDQCMKLISGTSDRWLETYVLRILAGVYRETGRTEAALSALRQSLRISTSVGDLHELTLAQIALAETHFILGGCEQAREYVELAQGRLKEEKSRSLFITGLIQRLIGEIETASQRYAVAKQHIAQSISVFGTIDTPYQVARSHYAMGLLLAAAGDNAGADGHLLRAKEIFENLEARPGVEATLRAYQSLSSMTKGAPPASAGSDGTHAGQRHSAASRGADIAEKMLIVTSANERAAESLANVQASNDVLLMERLIEASASRDLLLQELCSVIYENFPAEHAIVRRKESNGLSEPIACAGIAIGDASRITFDGPDLTSAEVVDGPGPPYVFHVSAAHDEGFDRGGNTGGFLLYIGAASGGALEADLSRLQPLIRQVELGLEMCSLRAAAVTPSAPPIEHRAQTVMPGFIVGSPGMFKVLEKIHKIRTSDVTVLITGESGTGKELVARALHAESARARAIFLPFNCTATPRDLIESQLFGHRRGAFTGATTNYPGMVRAAEGGTLFLDEIGDVALEVQPKLMRFLQEGEIQPLGETRPVKVDVRVVAATNSDLERAVEEGRFREDLFHRLNIIRIHVPPLRERREEIPALAGFFLDHFASRSGKPRLILTQEAMDALTEYEWPGNVRQLRNEIERVSAYASDGARVSADDLTPEIASGAKRLSSRYALGAYARAGGHNGPTRGIVPPDSNHVGATSHPVGNGTPVKLKDAVADLESRLIKDSLARNRNNVSRTAFELGLSRRGLRLKLAQLGIDKD
jgi:DNA-binding NtrC family response regulator/tetratricopeptide (TPR) repeat protein/transposase